MKIYTFLFLTLFTFISCDQGETRIYSKNKASISQEESCDYSYSINKSKYSEKDTLIKWMKLNLAKVENDILQNTTNLKEKRNSKFGSFTLYDSKKLVNEVFLKNIKLVTIKHEVYNIDDCNFVAKMTKYYYRSKRVKSIYYFLYQEEVFKGCVVVKGERIFKKGKTYLNISHETLAINWSKRILNNMIKKNFK
jgi:hypothetical protein